MPDDTNFQPPKWRYEPISIARQRAQSTVTKVADQVSPLVMRGDTPSLLEAQRIVSDEMQDPGQQMRQQQEWRTSVGDAARTRITAPQEAPAEDGGLLGGAADTWRSIVPQQVRDVLGGTLRSLTSAEAFGNFLDQAVHNSPSANLDEIAPGTAGTAVGESLGRIPVVGGAARAGFDVGASPLSLVTAGTGGLGASALGDTFASRLAAQVAGAVGGKYGSEGASAGAKALGGDELAQGAAGLVGGLAGGAVGIGAAKGIGAAVRGLQGADEAAALSAADVPRETSLPGGIGTAVPTEEGTRYVRGVRGGDDVPDAIAELYAKLTSGKTLTPAEEAQARQFVEETKAAADTSGGAPGLRPDLERTNKLRAARGLEPLPEEPAAWSGNQPPPEVAPTVPPTTGPMAKLGALKAKIAAEGMTPENKQAFNELAADTFANTPAPWEQPPPPVTPGGEGERIGNAIIAKAEGAGGQPPVRPPAPPNDYPAGFNNEPLFNPDAGYRQPIEWDPETGRPTKWVTNQGQILEGDPAVPQATPISPQERLELERLTAERNTPTGASQAINPERMAALEAGDRIPAPPDGLWDPRAGLRTPGGRDIEGNRWRPVSSPPLAPVDMGATDAASMLARRRAFAESIAEPGASQAIDPGRTLSAAAQPTRGRQLGMEGTPPIEETTGTLKQNALDLATAPRQLMASGDLSASFRQAAMAAPSHPRAWWTAMGDQIRAFRDPEAAQAVLDRIDANPLRPYLDRMGVELTSPTGSVAGQEEAFQHGSTAVSRAIARVPLVARSERAYTTALNSFRSGIAFDILGSRFTPEQLQNLSDGQLKALGGFVNAITGRGTLPAALEPHAQTLNALFFAPRNFIGKVQANLAVLSSDPNVRAEAAKSLAAFYGTGIGILAAAKLAGLNVGVIPTSSDFGKITLPGGTRVDIWGGNQQMYRMIANLATGQTTSPRTGQSYDQDRLTTVTRFLRSKLAPIPSTALNVATGSDSGGQDMRYDPGSVGSQALRLVTPLFLQDLYDATTNANPAEGVLAGALSGVGIGAQAYQKGPADDAAQAAYQKPYAALTSVEKADLQNANPGLGDQIVAEQAKSSGPAGQAATIRQQTQGQQQAADQQLLSGQMTRQDWLKQRSDRLTLQRGQLMQVYGNNPVTDAEAASDPMKRYIQAIQRATDPETGAVNPIALEQSRATFGPEVNAQIDRSLGTSGTPLEKAYRAAAASYYATPKYAGYSADEGAMIDRAKALVTGMATAIPGTDRQLAYARALRQLTVAGGPLAGLPPRVITGIRASINGNLPVTTARKMLERRDPAVGFFFGAQVTPAQTATIRTQQARPPLPAALAAAR